jgi:hypothetical protein
MRYIKSAIFEVVTTLFIKIQVLSDVAPCRLVNTGSFFIAAPSTTALSHRKSASAGTSLDSCGAQDSDKRNAL